MAMLLKGAGVSNICLLNGFEVSEFDGDKCTAILNIEKLYMAIAEAIAFAAHNLTAEELKFLRKRLEYSQEEVGALIGKTCQAVAKWEKSSNPVPMADGKVIRLHWIHKFVPERFMEAGNLLKTKCDLRTSAYVFYYEKEHKAWEQVHNQEVWTTDGDAATVIAKFRTGYSIEGVKDRISLNPIVIDSSEEVWS